MKKLKPATKIQVKKWIAAHRLREEEFRREQQFYWEDRIQWHCPHEFVALGLTYTTKRLCLICGKKEGE